MLKHMIFGAILLSPLVAAEESNSTNPYEQYLTHMNKLMEITKDQQKACIEAASATQCVYNEKFLDLLKQSEKSMKLSPESWPSDYFDKLLKQGSQLNMEELIELYKNTVPSTATNEPTSDTI